MLGPVDGSLLLLTCVTNAVTPTALSKVSLINHLWNNYSKEVAPLKELMNVVEMNITFHLRNILSLEETSEILTSSGWIDILWYDFRLAWDKSSYGGIDKIYKTRGDVWIPDVTVDNTASQYKVVGQEKDILRITSDGLVRWIPGDVFRTRCSMDIMYFPFDDQTCVIEILTWTLTLDIVKIVSAEAPFTAVLEEHGEWEVTGVNAQIDNRTTVTAAIVYIDIRRRNAFHVLNIVVPVITATFINAFVFILPAEGGEKITLATALFLSYAVFLSYITDNMPNTSTSVSFLGGFVAGQLVLSALSILCTVAILKLHHKDSSLVKTIPAEGSPFIGNRFWKKLNMLFFVAFFVLGVGASATLVIILNLKVD